MDGRRSSMTTSVYMYESDQMQSTEMRLQQMLNMIDNKYNQKCTDIINEFNVTIAIERDRIEKIIEKHKILVDYINLPWYKKIFKSFNKYEYERNKI